MMNVFRPAAIRSHINAAVKGVFVYDHENKWFCNGYTLVKVIGEAEQELRARLMAIDRSINFRDGRENINALPNFNAMVSVDLIKAQRTKFLIVGERTSRQERVFKAEDGSKTVVDEKYVKLAGQRIEWFIQKDDAQHNRKVIGKYNGEVVLLILPVAMSEQDMTL